MSLIGVINDVVIRIGQEIKSLRNSGGWALIGSGNGMNTASSTHYRIAEITGNDWSIRIIINGLYGTNAGISELRIKCVNGLITGETLRCNYVSGYAIYHLYVDKDNTTGKFYIRLYSYAGTTRTATWTFYKDLEDTGASPSFVINSAYVANGSNYTQQLELDYIFEYTDNTRSNYYGNLSGTAGSANLSYTLYNANYTAGEALIVENLIFLSAVDNKWYKANTAGRTIPIGTMIARCAGTYALNATTGAYLQGRFAVPNGVSGLVTGNDVFIRGSLSGTSLITDGTITTALSPGYSYIRFGSVVGGVVNFDGNNRVITLDAKGDLIAFDGMNLAVSGISVSQTNHGFSVGNAIGLSGATWIKTKADTYENAVTTGVVLKIVDANNFQYIKSGIVPGSYTPGAHYFLSTTTAGALMTLADPEVWTDGQVRQYVGTGTKDGAGLDVEIDLGDVVSFDIINDNYVNGISFTEATRVLTLTRTGSLAPLSIAIPFPSEEVPFEARDVSKGVAQTYVIDMGASWPYTIESLLCESDGVLNNCNLKINSTAVTGLTSFSVGSKTELTATALRSVAKNDVVTINTSASYAGTPTLIRLKMKYKRS